MDTDFTVGKDPARLVYKRLLAFLDYIKYYYHLSTSSPPVRTWCRWHRSCRVWSTGGRCRTRGGWTPTSPSARTPPGSSTNDCSPSSIILNIIIISPPHRLPSGRGVAGIEAAERGRPVDGAGREVDGHRLHRRQGPRPARLQTTARLPRLY